MNGFVKASRSTVWKSRCTSANASASSTHDSIRSRSSLESRERPVGDPPRLRLEEGRLDEEPQGVDLLAGAQRGGGDDDAVIRRRDDEPVALQPAERVAERGAADSERVHQPGVREPLTRRIRPVDDQVAEADVGILCRVPRAEQRGRQRLPRHGRTVEHSAADAKWIHFVDTSAGVCESRAGPMIDWDAIRAWDEEYYAHVFVTADEYEHVPIARADGDFVELADGTRLLDFTSGLLCTNAGHRNERIRDAIVEALDRYGFVWEGYATDYRSRAAKLIVDDLLGEDDWAGRVRFCSSGSEAIEMALLVAKLVTGRPNVISRDFAYHGWTHGALSLMGLPGARGILAVGGDRRDPPPGRHPDAGRALRSGSVLLRLPDRAHLPGVQARRRDARVHRRARAPDPHARARLDRRGGRRADLRCRHVPPTRRVPAAAAGADAAPRDPLDRRRGDDRVRSHGPELRLPALPRRHTGSDGAREGDGLRGLARGRPRAQPRDQPSSWTGIAGRR